MMPDDEALSRFQLFIDRVGGPVIRAFRTFVQTAVGVYLAGTIANPTISDLADIGLIDSAVAAGAVAALSLIQNLLEQSRNVVYDRG